MTSNPFSNRPVETEFNLIAEKSVHVCRLEVSKLGLLSVDCDVQRIVRVRKQLKKKEKKTLSGLLLDTFHFSAHIKPPPQAARRNYTLIHEERRFG